MGRLFVINDRLRIIVCLCEVVRQRSREFLRMVFVHNNKRLTNLTMQLAPLCWCELGIENL
jgi:hypothetical protein